MNYTSYLGVKVRVDNARANLALKGTGRNFDATGRSAEQAHDKAEKASRGFGELGRAISRASGKRVTVDTSEVDRKILLARKEIAELNAMKADPEIDADTSSIDERIKILRGQLAALDAKKIDIKIDADEARSDVAGLGSDVFRTNANFNLLRNTVSTLRLPAKLGAFGLAAQGVISLAGGVVSLTSALAPASGALVAAPALFGTYAQAAGVMALAGVDDLTDAVGGLNEGLDEESEAFKRLTPQAQDFARRLQSVKGPLREIQEGVQSKLFSGADKGLASATKNFDALDFVMQRTAGTLGELAEEGGEFLGRDGFGRDFKTIGAGNAEILGDLGTAGFHFADALRIVLVEAQPFLQWMSNGVVTFSRYVEESARAGQQTGDLAEFFRDSKSAIGDVVSIGGSLVHVLGNIGDAAKPFGDDMLQDLRLGANELERITGSLEGRRAMHDFFADSAADIEAMQKALGDILDEGDLGDMIARTIELAVPAIASHAGQLGAAIAKGLVEGFMDAGVIGKLFSAVTLIRLVGGAGALRKVGTAMAGPMLGGMSSTVAGPTGTATATMSGKTLGRAAGAGMVLGLALEGPAIIKQIQKIIGGTELGDTNRESFAAKVEGYFGAPEGSGDFLGKWKVRLETDVGKLIFDSRTGKVIDAKGKLLRRAIGDSYSEAFQVVEGIESGRIAEKVGFDELIEGFDETGARARKNGKDLQSYFDDLARGFKDASRDADGHKVVFSRAMDAIGGKLGGGEADLRGYVAGLSSSFRRGNDKTRNFRDDAGGNILGLSGIFGSALQTINTNLNNSLGSVGAKKINYKAIAADPNGRSLGRQHGGLVPGFRTGSLVPGSGSGDKVPLHLGGQLAAMVEPGELVSVANRNATAALMAHNAAVPRFATGGVIQQALGPYDMPPIAYDPSHAGGNSHLHLDFYTVGQALAYGHKMQQMGWSIDEYTPKGGNPWGFGGISASHQSPGHYDGTAFDANTAADETRSEVEAVVRMLGGKAIAGGLAVTLKKVLVDGPDGPMKDLAQAGVDKAWKAASAYLSKHSPAESGVGFGSYGGSADVKSLPASLQRWNHTFPGAVLQNDPGAWMSLATMPFNVAAAIAEWAGMPGVTMAQVSKGEGGLRPGSMGDDNGDGTPDGFGWLAITRPYGDSYGVDKYGGYQGMLNPVANAIVAKGMYDAQGLGAWYGQRYVSDTNAHYTGPLLRARGGLVAKLAKGSDGKWTHEVSDPGFSHGLSLSNLVRLKARLAELTGESGSIARIDERIDLVSRLAALDSSPAGSDLSDGERSAAIALNTTLLRRLVKERDLSNEGLALVSSAMKYASPAERKRLKGFASVFSANLVDVQGLTGKSGRIADVLLTLAELGSSSATTDSDVSDIADLGQIIDAARYGTFDYRSDPNYAGTFGRGGRLRAGQWGIAGETGKAEVIAGPARVFDPAQSAAMVSAPSGGGETFVGYADVYIGGEKVADQVRMEFAKRDRKAWLAEKAGR